MARSALLKGLKATITHCGIPPPIGEGYSRCLPQGSAKSIAGACAPSHRAGFCLLEGRVLTCGWESVSSVDG